MLFGLCFSVCGLAFAKPFFMLLTLCNNNGVHSRLYVPKYTPEDFTLKIDIEACKLAAKTIVIYGNAGTGKTQWTLTQFKHPLLVNHVDDLKEIVPGAVDPVACARVVVAPAARARVVVAPPLYLLGHHHHHHHPVSFQLSSSATLNRGWAWLQGIDKRGAAHRVTCGSSHNNCSRSATTL